MEKSKYESDLKRLQIVNETMREQVMRNDLKRKFLENFLLERTS